MHFTPPNLTDPKVSERIPGSMFSPAIAAWSSPGALGAYLGVLPGWSGMAAAAALLGLAYFKKIPWWAGLGGAAAAYWYLGSGTNTIATLTSGTVISANGSTLYLSANSPGTLVTQPDGSQLVQAGQYTYPVLSIQKNPDGSMTYFVDNPSSTLLPSA
jgi:hypothetical protein